MNDVRIKDIISPGFFHFWRELWRAHFLEYWAEGGRGSTKSSFLSLFLISLMVQDPEANVVVFRKHKIDIRSSVLEQMVWAIRILGLEDYYRVSVSPAQIEDVQTGQKVFFRGLDDPKKTKSIKVARGAFKAAWFEELDEFSGYGEIHSAIESVARGVEDFRVLCSYNPPESSANWVNVESIRANTSRFVHKSDYRSVPEEWLGPVFLNEAKRIKRERPDLYRHIYLGEITGTGAEVFHNIKIRRITDAEIANFKTKRRGLDFGFSNDPTALISANYERSYHRVWIFGEWWKHEAFDDDIWRDGIVRRGLQWKPINADSEDPRLIRTINRRGARLTYAVKGPNSVNDGITWLRRQTEIIVDPVRCPNATRELSRYEYARLPDGSLRSEYPDKDNHSIDAIRYALEEFIREGRGSRFI